MLPTPIHALIASWHGRVAGSQHWLDGGEIGEDGTGIGVGQAIE